MGSVIRSYGIYVVYTGFVFWIWYECFSNKYMHSGIVCYIVFTQSNFIVAVTVNMLILYFWRNVSQMITTFYIPFQTSNPCIVAYFITFKAFNWFPNFVFHKNKKCPKCSEVVRAPSYLQGAISLKQSVSRTYLSLSVQRYE